MIINIHILASPFHNGSRVLKETHSLISAGVASKIYIIALWQSGQEMEEYLDDRRTVLRLKLRTKEWPKTVFFQAFKLLEYMVRVVALSIRLKVNMVNVHTVDLLPLGWLIKTMRRGKLIYDAHELETEQENSNGVRKKFSKAVERLFIRSCSFVIVVSDTINNWYRSTYNISNVITVKNCPYFNVSSSNLKILHKELDIPPNRKILIYQGMITKDRGIEQFLTAFSKNDDKKHVLVCMGFGPLCDLVKEYADKHENIFFREAVEPDAIITYTGSADYGIAVMDIDNAPLSYRYSLPNKFFEYIMAGKPVLVNGSEEMKSIVGRHEIGVILPKLTYEAIADGLRQIDSYDCLVLQKRLEEVARIYSWGNQHDIMIQGYRKYLC